MKKNLLCCALLGAMAISQSAMAQDFDDRWYVSGGVGGNVQDDDRGTGDTGFLSLGFGKFVTPNWSIDAELNYQNPVFPNDLNFSQYGLSLDARYHLLKEGRNWNPFFRFGLGTQRVEEEFDNTPSPTSPGQREDSAIAATLGAGLQADYGRYAMRAEVAARSVTDDTSVVAPGSDTFTDLLAQMTVLVKLGDLPAPVVPEEPKPQVTCADLDDDGDGVNNCDDKCPGSVAGQAIGPDGCAVPLTIDLKGVNFDFDQATLRPDAVTILNEAIDILKKYPQLRVEVAGHTDSVGTDAYNQGLSERRARTVFDYLTSNGVDASRLNGPTGYGEARPIDTNDTAEGRAKNRRTELNVQN